MGGNGLRYGEENPSLIRGFPNEVLYFMMGMHGFSGIAWNMAINYLQVMILMCLFCFQDNCGKRVQIRKTLLNSPDVGEFKSSASSSANI